MRPTMTMERTETREGWLTSKEVMALTGITYRQLDVWVSTGTIPAAYLEDPNPGSGQPRMFRPGTVEHILSYQESLAACPRCGK